MGAAVRISENRQAQNDYLVRVFKTRGTELRFAPSNVIEAQGHPVTSVYRIRRGCVRTCMYTEDGDRKVLQFRGPGEFLGLSGASEWLASQEAVDTVIVDAVPRASFEHAVYDAAEGQRAIRDHLAGQVRRYASLLALTAHTCAADRVRAFLRGFARNRGSSGFVSLPMGRQDIADHLGLSMETVSRSITALRSRGEISMKGAAFFRFNDSIDGNGGAGLAHAA